MKSTIALHLSLSLRLLNGGFGTLEVHHTMAATHLRNWQLFLENPPIITESSRIIHTTVFSFYALPYIHILCVIFFCQLSIINMRLCLAVIIFFFF